MAQVVLKGRHPNTTYAVNIVQDIPSCLGGSTLVTTDGQGNATVHLSKPRTGTYATVEIVSLGTPDKISTPSVQAP